MISYKEKGKAQIMIGGKDYGMVETGNEDIPGKVLDKISEALIQIQTGEQPHFNLVFGEGEVRRGITVVDGIVYAVCVGLGFAAIENVGYVLSSGEGWATVASMRALLAVPGHYAFAILMGYYYAVYHFVDHSKIAAAKVILIPVLAHGVYDSLAMTGSVDPIAGGICFFALIYFCIKLQKAAQKKVNELVSR